MAKPLPHATRLALDAPEQRRFGFFWQSLVLLLIVGAGFATWHYDLIAPLLKGTQTETIMSLQDQNRLLSEEVARLRNDASATDSPNAGKIRDLQHRLFIMEQQQNSLIEAVKGPQPSGFKRSSLLSIPGRMIDEEQTIAQVDEQLKSIELRTVDLASHLVERSDKNTRVLSHLLSSVSDRLVSQRLFGKAATGNTRNMGGPYQPEASKDAAHNGSAPDVPQVVTVAIASMQQHALLYHTLVNLPLARPLSGDVQYVSGFGNRADPFTRQTAFHAGIDLKLSPGSPILATGDGVIIHAGPADGYGHMVEIAHADGVTTRYGHLDKIIVTVGDAVRTGQKVGTLGSTGRSTGPHLHYETRIRDQAVNPIPFLQMGERLKKLNLLTLAQR